MLSSVIIGFNIKNKKIKRESKNYNYIKIKHKAHFLIIKLIIWQMFNWMNLIFFPINSTINNKINNKNNKLIQQKKFQYIKNKIYIILKITLYIQ
jgi:hypothetical protein